MRLYVPSIGNKLKLTADWEFPLFSEYRNYDAVRFLHPDISIERHYGSDLQSVATTLPVGMVLQVARLYVRRGKGDYDSITFKIVHHPGHVTKNGKYNGPKCQFWAKLEDCNFIEFEPEES
jgi:hypothetical protein